MLDLFCCEGGATAGYQRAGFHVTGVDTVARPNYPGDEFHQGDAVAFVTRWGRSFDLVAGSPPCHAHSTLNAYNGVDYLDLIPETRAAMAVVGRPYVIENVMGAPLHNPVVLCGTHFGLSMYRHRQFETGNGFVFAPPWVCRGGRDQHRWLCSRNGSLPTAERPFMSIHGGKHSRAWLERAAAEMGTPWVTSVESVCQAIPPAYTEHIGRAFLESRVAGT